MKKGWFCFAYNSYISELARMVDTVSPFLCIGYWICCTSVLYIDKHFWILSLVPLVFLLQIYIVLIAKCFPYVLIYTSRIPPLYLISGCLFFEINFPITGIIHTHTSRILTRIILMLCINLLKIKSVIRLFLLIHLHSISFPSYLFLNYSSISHHRSKSKYSDLL